MATIPEAIEEIDRLIRDRLYDDASRLCTDVLKADHRVAEAWHFRGLVAHLCQQNHDATAWLERAVRLQPDAA